MQRCSFISNFENAYSLGTRGNALILRTNKSAFNLNNFNMNYEVRTRMYQTSNLNKIEM